MPIMTSVSTWRCKCGIIVKVITQWDRRKQPSNQTAACPNCGITQLVYGDTVLSVTDDTANSLFAAPAGAS
jgi:hypothetical protein